MPEQRQLDLNKKEYWKFNMFEDLLNKSFRKVFSIVFKKQLLIFVPLKIQIRA